MAPSVLRGEKRLSWPFGRWRVGGLLLKENGVKGTVELSVVGPAVTRSGRVSEPEKSWMLSVFGQPVSRSRLVSGWVNVNQRVMTHQTKVTDRRSAHLPLEVGQTGSPN